MPQTLNTILRSTNSGKSNFHIGEKWLVGRTQLLIVSYFDHNGERFYVGAEPTGVSIITGKPGYIYHVIYKHNGKWRRMD